MRFLYLETERRRNPCGVLFVKIRFRLISADITLDMTQHHNPLFLALRPPQKPWKLFSDTNYFKFISRCFPFDFSLYCLEVLKQFRSSFRIHGTFTFAITLMRIVRATI